MTRAMLLTNVVEACERAAGIIPVASTPEVIA
jgi:hypothetical protein